MKKLRGVPFSIITDTVLILILALVGYFFLRPLSPRPLSPQPPEDLPPTARTFDHYLLRFLDGADFRYQIKADRFDCAATPDYPEVDECTVEFEGRQLVLRMAYFSDPERRLASFCQLSVDDQRVDCELTYNPEVERSEAVTEDDLGLPASRFDALREAEFGPRPDPGPGADPNDEPLLGGRTAAAWRQLLLLVSLFLGLVIGIWRWFRYRPGEWDDAGGTAIALIGVVVGPIVKAALAFLAITLGLNALDELLYGQTYHTFGPFAPLLGLLVAVLVIVWIIMERGDSWPTDGPAATAVRLLQSVAGGAAVLALAYAIGRAMLVALELLPSTAL